jgi:hypothetical protein
VRMVIAALVAGVVLLGITLPAFAQEDGGQEFCDWYWDYNLKRTGGWEYWCWHPQLGWWYAQSESGMTKIVTL